LAPKCHPIQIARQSDFFYFEMPKYGGHVGFVSFNRQSEYWSETRALEFIKMFR
jgi:predicted alpha/beta-fold hydrolase